ncbi:hypothetical protein KSF_105380 [Reticulibacter mediterranei]|uniref:Short-chain dehydrogenase n=1 Tax=Reticulibacter mediterranei TaxID=2778369 RepID=A0A8J3IXX0_9CHLR|nr:PPOX class F420-dependent oxidoreductase [Reticulibacter mediterranei]GHP00491.1 hypothetical protein KSF_105380 [Reticulibacter mediterranei]
MTNSAATLEHFERQKNILLTSYRRVGTPVYTPVNIAVEGEHAFVRTWNTAGKFKRIRHHPTVEIAPSTVFGQRTGPAIRARARVLEGAEAVHAGQALDRKYPLLQGVLVPMIHRLGHYRTIHIELTPLDDLVGRTVLITGATAGIGRTAVIQLAQRGAQIIIVGRSEDRGRQAVADISAQSHNDQVSFLQADMGHLESVRRLAQVVRQQYPQVDTLVNNVAGLSPTRQETVDGLEATLAVTHLGPFLLTRLLVPLLEEKPIGRVVNLMSGTYRFGSLDPLTLEPSGPYRGFDAYMSAKLALLLTSLELARRTQGSTLRVLLADPGGADTDTLTVSLQPGMLSARMRLMATFFSLLVRRPGNLERAARSSVEAVTSTDLMSGDYLKANTRPSQIARVAQDAAFAQRVWAASNRLVGLPDDLRVSETLFSTQE